MKPTISIIIALAPGRNAEVLQSLNHVNYPKEKYEVIIEEGLNPSENRNRGAAKAQGTILAFIDDDAYLGMNTLELVEKFFEHYPTIAIVGGPQLTPKNDHWFAQLSGIAIQSYFGTQKMSGRYAKRKINLHANESILTSANCYVQKEAFYQIGGFDTRLFPGEDPEFFDRAHHKGFQLAYHPNIRVYHKRRNNYKDFVKQFYKYGKTRLRKEKITKGNKRFLFYLPAIFTISILPLFLLGFLYWIFWIPLLVYVILAVCFAAYESGKNLRLYGIILLPFLYLSIHVAYGLGMLKTMLST